MLELRHEPMGPHFDKWHLQGLPFPLVYHRFQSEDLGPCHDHPFGFTSEILSGGYVEQVYQPDGSSEVIHRRPGDRFHNRAQHIHRLLSIIDGDCCWTVIRPEAWEQHPGFYEFREDGTYRRAWNEPDFTRLP